MVVNYKGRDSEYNYRIAEITYDDEKEQSRMEQLQEIMSKEGWDIDIVTPGYAICEVDDMDSYKYFVQDWKKAKKEVK